MADPKNSKQSWEMLSAYLNLVLIQTGKILRNPDYRGTKAIGSAKSKVNEYVTAANGSFHDALDEVEIKILDAKSVLERDLSVIRKKRALREGVKIPLPAPSPADVPTASSNEAMQIEDLQIDASGDLPMLDADLLTAQLQNDTNVNQPLLSGDDMMVNDQAMPQDINDSAGLAIALPNDPSANEKDGPKPSGETDQNTGTKMEDIMGITDEQEQQNDSNALDFDFESMFNDTDFATADGSMEFSNVDFASTDQQVNQGQSGKTSGDAAAANADLGNILPTSNEDITGLLDDVFNQAGDTTNSNANPASTAPEPAKEAEAATAASGAATSEFDELFGAAMFNLSGDDEVIDDNNMTDFNFDEEFLKM